MANDSFIGKPQMKPPVAGSVVMCDDRFLVLEKPAIGEFRLPKGKREHGESILQTAMRETTEESGYFGFEFIAQLGTASVIFRKKMKLVERYESYVLLSLDQRQLEKRGVGEEKFRPQWLCFDLAIKQLSFEAEKRWARIALDYLKNPNAFS